MFYTKNYRIVQQVQFMESPIILHSAFRIIQESFKREKLFFIESSNEIEIFTVYELGSWFFFIP